MRARAATTATAVGGPCHGQRLIVHPGKGGYVPDEVWVHRPILPADDPWPTKYHRYVRSGEDYRYAPEADQAA